MLTGIEDNASLPYASSLCGACYDACPVKIDIPSVLVHLRARHVEEVGRVPRVPAAEALTMAAASWVMASPARYGAAQRAGRLGGCPAGAARSGGCRPRCPAGPRPGTCPCRRPRRSANGGAEHGGRPPGQ